MPTKNLKPATSNSDCPNIGKLLDAHLKKKRITRASLSQKLNKDPSVITRTLRCKTIQTDTLWQACHALGYNIFAELAVMLPAGYESEAMGKMRAELEEVKKERDLLKGVLVGR